MQLPTKLSQRQTIIIAAVALIAIVGMVVFFMNIRKGAGGSTQALNLTIWGTDDSKVFADLTSAYTGPGSGTNMNVKYVHIDAADYRNTLLSALAAGRGPDIFEISNRDLSQWKSVLMPLPATVSTTFTLASLASDFPTVVSEDFVSSQQIYALPMGIDTLAMIYNKDLMDSAGIPTLPATWTDFAGDIPQLRTVNAAGQLTRAAGAIGGSEQSIANAPDLVFLLMLQNGTQMVQSDGSSVAFGQGAGAAGAAGLAAFNYYLQFANPLSPSYTWNDSMGNSVDAFAQGKTAVIFDYASTVAAIKTKAPFLNFGVAPIPQVPNASTSVNYAKYVGLAVSRTSPSAAAAWSFILNLTTSPSSEKIYMNDTGLPPAFRPLIGTAFSDPNIGVFARQELSARSWHEANSTAIDAAMDQAIRNVLAGAVNSQGALSEAASQINGGQ